MIGKGSSRKSNRTTILKKKANELSRMHNRSSPLNIEIELMKQSQANNRASLSQESENQAQKQMMVMENNHHRLSTEINPD